ncbi:MAG: hypothetical protein ACYDIA_01645 [Candidatus Humimicrobiaceae bacterium]
MKNKKFIVYLLVMALLSFILISCGKQVATTTTRDSITMAAATATTKNHNDIKYIVIGLNSMDIKYADNSTRTFPISPKVSVTYSNSQGGTEQISEMSLKKDVSSLGLSGITNPDKWSGEIIAEYKNSPIDNFLYISAQNQSPGNIIVIILVDGVIWKNSLAKGMYSIAEASGVFQ